jgi:hypothetical protein
MGASVDHRELQRESEAAFAVLLLEDETLGALVGADGSPWGGAVSGEPT